MKFKIAALIIATILSFSANAAFEDLSSESRVVLFTCGPGPELYAGFGHSALWVSDPIQNIDRLYNYGTFDFNTPNFYQKFIKGRLNYMVTVTTLRRFLSEYSYRKIEVKGQDIELELNEKQKLYELLETNILPENRFYKYDFFYDNCATRIRDVVLEAIDGSVDFNTKDRQLTFREMLFPYLEHSPWTKMGINLILGLSSDKIASVEEYMYLPEWMYLEFGNAVVDRNGELKVLVKNERTYLDSKLNFSYNFLTDPALSFGLLFLLLGWLSVWGVRKGKHHLSIDIILNIVGVLSGLFLLFMWVGTDHSATNKNLNILWLLPAQALFLISLLFDVRKRITLIRFSFAILFMVVLMMQFWSQPAELSFLILIIIFVFRYLLYLRFLKSGQ